ncbi:hypothetical protein Bca4012_021521 [Brassica carinata]
MEISELLDGGHSGVHVTVEQNPGKRRSWRGGRNRAQPRVETSGIKRSTSSWPRFFTAAAKKSEESLEMLLGFGISQNDISGVRMELQLISVNYVRFIFVVFSKSFNHLAVTSIACNPKDMSIAGNSPPILFHGDGLVWATKKKIQLQAELLGKKIESEAKARQELKTKSSAFLRELKKIEFWTESSEKSQVYAKPWLSRDELEKMYED